jgi:RHS repeat-associated protein
LARTYRYDSFGKITAQTGGLDQPFAFTGREYDPETGLYYYRARYYDPKAGRFISKDPIGFGGGDVNLFRYVGNDPVDFTDPEGKSIWGWFKCGQFVEKYMKALKQCMKECDKDELMYDDKYGGVSDFSNNLNCVCNKMGYGSMGYADCLRTYKECITNAVIFPLRPNK